MLSVSNTRSMIGWLSSIDVTFVRILHKINALVSLSRRDNTNSNHGERVVCAPWTAAIIGHVLRTAAPCSILQQQREYSTSVAGGIVVNGSTEKAATTAVLLAVVYNRTTTTSIMYGCGRK